MVSTHPDDKVLVYGGIMLKMMNAGAEVYVKFLGECVFTHSPFGQDDYEGIGSQASVCIMEKS